MMSSKNYWRLLILLCIGLSLKSMVNSKEREAEADDSRRRRTTATTTSSTSSPPPVRKVIMHIGPHKTGSTHIHTYLDKISEQLPSFHYCWPVPRGNIMYSNMLPIHFLSNHTVHHISIEWLHKCINTSQHLILSAEAFDRFTIEHFQEFYLYLQQYGNFQFEIIIIYREWINHMYSLYTEIHKYTVKGIPFSEFFFKQIDVINEIPILNMTCLVTSYASVIGMQHIHLLDYYGILAAGKDEAYVIVCEIMGILCQESEYLNNKQIKENEKPDMIATELFQLIRNQAYLLGCKLSSEKREFITEWVKSYRSVANVTIPTEWTTLKLIQPIAIRFDFDYQRKYKSILLYGNHTANVEAIHKFNITEINKMGFFSDEHCLHWLLNEVKTQIQLKKFINCQRNVVHTNEIGNTSSVSVSRRRAARHHAHGDSPVESSSFDEGVLERVKELRKKVSQTVNGM